MTRQQLTHEQTKIDRKTFPVTIVCDDIIISENVGAMFRVAEALGAEQLILMGQTSVPPNRKIRKASRSTDRFVPFEYAENKVEAIEKLKDKGYRLVGVEITNDSIPLTNYKIPANQPIALVMGAEKYGISDEVLPLLDECVIIEMFGQNSSMNVVSALSIALYEVTRQLK
ncbi:TrmH family RNA methyltransferase [Prolixibacteraceae bacterium JC049]|nr:TrmH family RNA methyltransferase [Prolixibacteraceae bacterium JC049]